MEQLDRLKMEPRSLGKSDFPDEYPLKEIYIVAKHCSGGVILGFEQFRSEKGIKHPGTAKETVIDSPVPFPTPWNHIEAGILFCLRLPLLIFREPALSGGVFDVGVTDVFVHEMPRGVMTIGETDELGDIFNKWQAKVHNRYREF